MSDKELKAYVTEMRAFGRKVASSPKKSKDFLVAAGICTKGGKLAKPYK